MKLLMTGRISFWEIFAKALHRVLPNLSIFVIFKKKSLIRVICQPPQGISISFALSNDKKEMEDKILSFLFPLLTISLEFNLTSNFPHLMTIHKKKENICKHKTEEPKHMPEPLFYHTE